MNRYGIRFVMFIRFKKSSNHENRGVIINLFYFLFYILNLLNLFNCDLFLLSWIIIFMCNAFFKNEILLRMCIYIKCKCALFFRELFLSTFWGWMKMTSLLDYAFCFARIKKWHFYNYMKQVKWCIHTSQNSSQNPLEIMLSWFWIQFFKSRIFVVYFFYNI